MDLFKATPDQVAKYRDFLAKFSRSPRQALDPFVIDDSEAGPGVSPQLLLYMAVSAGIALLLTLLGTAVGMAPDSSWIVTVVGRMDEKVLPLAAVALVVIIAVIWHALAKLVGWLLACISITPPFQGKVAGSINAILAFTTWFLPLFTAVLILVRVAALRLPGVPPALFLIAVFLLSLLFAIYLVLSFAAAHRISVGFVFILFGFTVVGLNYLTDVMR